MDKNKDDKTCCDSYEQDILDRLAEMGCFSSRTVSDLDSDEIKTGSLSNEEVSNIVHKLESDLLADDSGSEKMIERIYSRLGILQEKNLEEAQLLEDIEKIALFYKENDIPILPNEDRTVMELTSGIDYHKILSVMKTKPDYKFYDRLRSCFDPEKMFTEENIIAAEKDEDVLMLEVEDDCLLEKLIFEDQEETKLVAPTRFTKEGDVRDVLRNALANIDLSRCEYIKNVSDSTLMLPTGKALRPFHMMQIDSVCHMNQKEIDSLKESSPIFKKQIMLGNILPCKKEEIDLLEKHIKGKKFDNKHSMSDCLVDAAYVYEIMVSLLRKDGKYKELNDEISKREKEGIETNTIDKIRISRAILVDEEAPPIMMTRS